MKFLKLVSSLRFETSLLGTSNKDYTFVECKAGDIVMLLTDNPLKWGSWSTHLFMTFGGVGHHLTYPGNELRSMIKFE